MAPIHPPRPCLQAVILTTHSMQEAEVLCDRLGIFVDGELYTIGNPRDITGARPCPPPALPSSPHLHLLQDGNRPCYLPML